MPLIYRTEKGAPLTAEEVDNNFRELDQRLHTLEEHPESGESLGKIEMENGTLTFHGTFGTNFGTFPLPKPKLNPCGSWQSGKTYDSFDLVTFGNTLYCCKEAHTSNTWESKYWKEILSLPPPPSSTLPYYEHTTLPSESPLGTLAVLMEQAGPSLIFFNGKTWQHLMKGETL